MKRKKNICMNLNNIIAISSHISCPCDQLEKRMIVTAVRNLAKSLNLNWNKDKELVYEQIKKKGKSYEK